MFSPEEALKELKAGNLRYLNSQKKILNIGEERRRQLLHSQKPFAVILGCSDSRVPAEIVFDQGLGDLFVIRVAGNIATPSQTGSVEYAVTQLKARLVVVLGHTHCGAVISAIEQSEKKLPSGSPNLDSILSQIKPSVETLKSTHDARTSPEELVGKVVRANILNSVNQLTRDSKIMKQALASKQINIVGAEYDLKTGEVDFFHTP